MLQLSSYLQPRRPIEAGHSFSFSIVTRFFNMSAIFPVPQIFSKIICSLYRREQMK